MDYTKAYLKLANYQPETIREEASKGGLGARRRAEMPELQVPDREDIAQKYYGMVRSIAPKEVPKEEIEEYLEPESMSKSEQAPKSSSKPKERYDPSESDVKSVSKPENEAIAKGIRETAAALDMDPEVLATIISYETAGTFNPMKKGPTTKWGQHKGLIQFGEVQAKEYGVDFSDMSSAVSTQFGANGAITKYFKRNGWKPGMSELDAYSIVNAGAPGLHNRSDTAAGGAPGTVKDKVFQQFGPHRRKARALLGAFT